MILVVVPLPLVLPLPLALVLTAVSPFYAAKQPKPLRLFLHGLARPELRGAFRAVRVRPVHCERVEVLPLLLRIVEVVEAVPGVRRFGEPRRGAVLPRVRLGRFVNSLRSARFDRRSFSTRTSTSTSTSTTRHVPDDARPRRRTYRSAPRRHMMPEAAQHLLPQAI